MVERLCPHCQHGNPLENRFCGQCGTALARQQLAHPQQGPQNQIVVTGPQLPGPLKQVGQSLMLGLVALAAEAGLAWLQRRVQNPGLVRSSSGILPDSSRANWSRAKETSGFSTVVKERVVHVWEQGVLTKKMVEHVTWQCEE